MNVQGESLRLDMPLAKAAVEQLRKMKEGTDFKHKLFPALPEGIQWTLTQRKGENYWKLHGSFCGIPFRTVEINIVGHLMMLTEVFSE